MPYKNELQIAYNQIRKSNHLFLPSINRPNALDTIEFSQFLAFRKAETDPNGTVLHDILSVETVSQALRTKRSGVRIPSGVPDQPVISFEMTGFSYFLIQVKVFVPICERQYKDAAAIPAYEPNT